jgi:hypothetical protein
MEVLPGVPELLIGGDGGEPCPRLGAVEGETRLVPGGAGRAVVEAGGVGGTLELELRNAAAAGPGVEGVKGDAVGTEQEEHRLAADAVVDDPLAHQLVPVERPCGISGEHTHHP